MKMKKVQVKMKLVMNNSSNDEILDSEDVNDT